MKDISNPGSIEQRGLVMLMMMRAGETVDSSEVTPSVCGNTETQLLCLVESPNCPSECQIESSSTTGILTVSSATINP